MTSGVLTHIDSPAHLRGLNLEQLEELAQELRREILAVTSANGGHLATNLGHVELSIALHYAFDSPHDKIIWDVGNQCYAHKILTGRRDRFATIRKTAGLSGFVNRGESPHDHLTAGHAGTAVSAALGIASARDLRGEDYRVLAVVGDGAMTAGLSYEALNNLSSFGSQMLVILNDNSFSISPSCGGLAARLQQAQSRVLDGNIFEQLGVQYLGPVDGHDLALLLEVLHDLRRSDRPAVLHVITKKGRGFAAAESDPARYHGVTPFDLDTGQARGGSGEPTYSEVFGRELLRIADQDDRVVAITAAMCAGTGLTDYAERFPDRFFDVGIAEQHAVTFAAGLAAGGCRPVVAIYSAFLQRGYDQVIHDVCLQGLPVTFVVDRAGLVGADGPTHHGVLDLAYLRAVPRMVIMAPKDGEEFKQMLRLAVAQGAPAAVRFPRGSAAHSITTSERTAAVEVGRGELVQRGRDVGLIAIGSMVHCAVEVARALERYGVSTRVVNARFVKPLDATLLLETANQVERLYTLEEHVRQGGFGSAVLELLAQHHVRTPVGNFALPDEFIEHGSTDHLLDACGLSVSKIKARILADLETGKGSGDSVAPAIDAGRLREAIERVRQQALPTDLSVWVREYGKVGQRDEFLWRWCMEGVRLTTLSCVDPDQFETGRVTKTLGVMFDVLLDDVADQSGDAAYLEQLLRIPLTTDAVDFSAFSAEQQAYAEVTRGVWQAVVKRAQSYPRYGEFRTLLQFDYRQLLNAMRYSHMLNGDPDLLNLAEHDLYLPHNMHMMISGTLDLMCSKRFERAELGKVREALWHAQCMGRVGNLVTTWERELGENDFTSGVFAFAAQQGLVTVQECAEADVEKLRQTIAAHGCEAYFLNRWQEHRRQLLALSDAVRTVDLQALVAGLEQLLEIHLGSRGLK